MVTIFANGFNGRVESDGRIFDNPSGGCAIGHIDSEGRIWDHPEGGSNVGRVDSEGRLWGGTGGNIVGYIDSNGNILDSNRNVIGHLRDDGFFNSGTTRTVSGGEGSGCAGCIAVIMSFLVFAIRRSWGGRVGAIIGAVVLSVAVFLGDRAIQGTGLVGIVIFAIIGALLGGIVGVVIEKIVGLIMKKK
jgi:hypothetical protein